MVWGGRQLGEVLSKSLPNGELYGEAWEVSDHPSHASVVAHGTHKGLTLRHLMEQHAPLLLGAAAERHSRFPWLIKLLDAWDWLSVQVHPSDANVTQWWPGEGGKTEAWFVLAAAPNSRVYAGLLPGVDEKRLRNALREGTVGECLHQFSPRPGDCVFLPAGTVHAVGGGVLMAEVQQTSDATFRLFDWNRRDAQGRSRQLHIEEALACIDWNCGPVHPIRARDYPVGTPSTSGEGEGRVRGTLPSAESLRQFLVSCEYFTLEYLRGTEPFLCGDRGTLQALLVLHGSGELRIDDESWPLIAGDTLLLPASLEPAICRPNDDLGVLLSSLPTHSS
jgi:mannose-6-phosphate isomerase